MSLAFKAAVTSTQKIVLLALCDAANDQGECYPSVSTLTDKCSLSMRAVQTAIGELETMGYLRRDMRTGRSTVYWMTPAAGAPRTTCTPHDVHPTPARAAPPPPQQVHPTPAPRAPITIKEPSIEPSRKRKGPVVVEVELLIATGFSPDVAAEFIEHKDMLKAPLTKRAWDDHLRESAKAGWTPEQAAIKVIAKGWKGFESKYVADDRPPGSKPAETAYQRSMRERVDEITGGLLRPVKTGEIFDITEAVDATTRRLG